MASNKTNYVSPDTGEVKNRLTNCICPPLSINSDGGRRVMIMGGKSEYIDTGRHRVQAVGQ